MIQPVTTVLHTDQFICSKITNIFYFNHLGSGTGYLDRESI